MKIRKEIKKYIPLIIKIFLLFLTTSSSSLLISVSVKYDVGRNTMRNVSIQTLTTTTDLTVTTSTTTPSITHTTLPITTSPSITHTTLPITTTSTTPITTTTDLTVTTSTTTPSITHTTLPITTNTSTTTPSITHTTLPITTTTSTTPITTTTKTTSIRTTTTGYPSDIDYFLFGENGELYGSTTSGQHVVVETGIADNILDMKHFNNTIISNVFNGKFLKLQNNLITLEQSNYLKSTEKFVVCNNVIYAIYNNSVLFSNNAGIGFTVTYESPTNINSIATDKSCNIMIGGDNVKRSTDGGNTFVDVFTTTSTSFVKHFNNMWYTAGTSNGLFRSTNGDSWNTITRTHFFRLLDCDYRARDTTTVCVGYYTAGGNTMIRSTDDLNNFSSSSPSLAYDFITMINKMSPSATVFGRKGLGSRYDISTFSMGVTTNKNLLMRYIGVVDGI